MIKNDALIHSYPCRNFLEDNSSPWPTSREGDCYVGSKDSCDKKGNFTECDVTCRPKQHPDWTTC